MKSTRCRAFAAARVLVPAVVLVGLLAPSRVPADKVVAPKGETPAARAETRLRKLHLVRPDLIPYPIAFEVYC
jgi:hypothetical protein